MKLGDAIKTIIFWVVVMLIWQSCQSADAQTLPARLVIVKHKFATPLQQTQMVQLGLARLKETGVLHPVSKVTIVRDVLKKNSIKHYTGRLDAWAKLAYDKGWCIEGERCHLSLPPVYDAQGIDYGGGVAMSSCTVSDSWDASYSIQRMMNGSGQKRLYASITSSAHENGHNDGAEHDEINKPYIMHPDALKYGEVKLPWSKESKWLIDVCLLEEGIRPKSKYGFGDPNWTGRSYKRKSKEVEPLIH